MTRFLETKRMAPDRRLRRQPTRRAQRTPDGRPPEILRGPRRAVARSAVEQGRGQHARISVGVLHQVVLATGRRGDLVELTGVGVLRDADDDHLDRLGRVASDLSWLISDSRDSELESSLAPSVKITTELNHAGSQFSWAYL